MAKLGLIFSILFSLEAYAVSWTVELDEEIIDFDLSGTGLCVLTPTQVLCWSRDPKQRKLTMPGFQNPTKLAAGFFHTCVQDSDGIWCWSRGNRYDADSVPSVPGLVLSGTGQNTSCGRADDAIYCWGRNPATFNIPGLLSVIFSVNEFCARTTSGSRCFFFDGLDQREIHSDENLPASQIAVGMEHRCYVVQNKVTCKGENTFGQLDVPTGVKNPEMLVAGHHHSCVVSNGEVVCWGRNFDGALEVPLGVKNPRKMVASWHRTCVLDDEALKCWGTPAKYKSKDKYWTWPGQPEEP